MVTKQATHTHWRHAQEKFQGTKRMLRDETQWGYLKKARIWKKGRKRGGRYDHKHI